MTDFQIFINVNKLLKKDVAEYLGVSNAFITKLCDGRKNLPSQKLTLLIDNPNGWDTSMLSAGTQNHNRGVIVNGNNSHSPIDNRQYYSDSPDVLRAQIEILDERIKEKDAQIKEKDAQIKEKDAQIKRLLDILSKR